MKYLKCLKLRPKMECKLSEIIWFTKDGLDFLEKVFEMLFHVFTPILVYLNVIRRYAPIGN